MGATYAVTGVGGAIGAALAALLKARGHRVIGLDLQNGTENVDRFIPLDLNNPATIDRAVEAVDEPLDGLCNNAGLPSRTGWQAMILQVNFLGPRRLTEALLDRFASGASIVNTASRAGALWDANLDQVRTLAAIRDRPGVDAFVSGQGLDASRCYTLSKEAVIAWTHAMTAPLAARDLRMNAISPGAVATGILDDSSSTFGDQVARSLHRARRAGTPLEVAEVAAFLLSPESHWIKGADIPVDGGLAACNLTDKLDLVAMTLPDDGAL